MSRDPFLYELVGGGLSAYSRLADRPVFTSAPLRLGPGEVLACTHLSDADVPVLAGVVWRGGRMWRDASALRPAFAVRNDMLAPGFLAGYPPGLPIAVRRLLFGLDIGPLMHDGVRCLPVRFSDRLRVVEALRDEPDLELEAVLPQPRVAALRERARRLRRPLPRVGRDVLQGGYADLLWEVVGADELAGPAWQAMWARHASRSGGELREVLAWVRDGGALAIFPHGSPSPDGGVNPIDPRVGRLLAATRARAVIPVGLAYDPLVRGRMRAFTGVGPPLAPLPRTGGERVLLDGLRRATPLTCGLVVARHAAARGRMPDAPEARAALGDALARAQADGRPVDPALRRRRRRERRLADALAAGRRLGAAHPHVVRAARTLTTALEAA